MFSRIASQSVRRLVSFQSASSNGVKQVSRSSFAAFSTAEIVPGIGLGKTSTGIVSSTQYNCTILLFLRETHSVLPCLTQLCFLLYILYIYIYIIFFFFMSGRSSSGS